MTPSNCRNVSTERRAQLVFVSRPQARGKNRDALFNSQKTRETLFFAAQNATKDEQLASFSCLMFERVPQQRII